MSTPLDVREWLHTTTPRVVLGHIKMPAAAFSLPSRAQELIDEATKTRRRRPSSSPSWRTRQSSSSSPSSCGRLPQARVTSGFDPSSQACVIEYGSLLELLRSPETGTCWSQRRLVVLADMDVHYSAQFALCMLELMTSAREGAHPLAAVARIATVSLWGPEKSLEKTVLAVCVVVLCHPYEKFEILNALEGRRPKPVMISNDFGIAGDIIKRANRPIP